MEDCNPQDFFGKNPEAGEGEDFFEFIQKQAQNFDKKRHKASDYGA